MEYFHCQFLIIDSSEIGILGYYWQCNIRFRVIKIRVRATLGLGFGFEFTSNLKPPFLRRLHYCGTIGRCYKTNPGLYFLYEQRTVPLELRTLSYSLGVAIRDTISGPRLREVPGTGQDSKKSLAHDLGQRGHFQLARILFR